MSSGLSGLSRLDRPGACATGFAETLGAARLARAACGPRLGRLARQGLGRALFGPPAMFRPAPRPGGAAGAGKGVTVLAHGAEPTVAYYFRSRFAEGEALFIDTRRTSPDALTEREMADLLRGRRVIIARHAPLSWLKALARRRGETASVAYFMDDDLPGAALDADLPWRYALRLTSAFRRISPLLAAICDRVLVSTPALAGRYPEAQAEVLPPLPLRDDDFDNLDMASHWSAPMFAIFYHGTASHTRELAFVADVARMVQAERQDTIFEVFGPRAALRPFAGIPRVRKLHPMPWEDYLAHARANPMHIGLAPLLGAENTASAPGVQYGQWGPGSANFNSFRAATKVFDIARCRAVGLFSDVAPFNSHIKHNASRLLLKNDARIWAGEILNLLEDSRPAMAGGGI